MRRRGAQAFARRGSDGRGGPLSATFDHVGPITRSVADAATLWAVLAGREIRPIETPAPRDITLGALGDYFTAMLESEVRSTFERAVERLRSSGVGVVQRTVSETDAIIDTYVNISLAEAAHWHAETLDSRPEDYQQPVRERLERGRTVSAVSYLRARDVREVLTRAVDSGARGMQRPRAADAADRCAGARRRSSDDGCRPELDAACSCGNAAADATLQHDRPSGNLDSDPDKRFAGWLAARRPARQNRRVARRRDDMRARVSGGGTMKVSVGQRAERSLTLTAEHVATFAQLTGDYNPLHFDEAFAAKTKFGRLVVQGGLTTGLLHALVAMDMPGPGTVFLSQNWKFTAPVYIDDTITASAEVLSVHATKPVTQLTIRVTRQTGEVVLEGEAWCYTFEPRAE